MAIKQKDKPSFMDKKTKEAPKKTPAPTVELTTPGNFLTSKGFTQVHEGQRFPGTYEDVINLLQEYKAL